MILLLKRASALFLAVAVAALGTPVYAQQEVASPVTVIAPVGGASAAAGASMLAPLSAVPTLPAAADGPVASLTPSPWNPAAPTVLIAAPAAKLAPAALSPAAAAAPVPALAPPAGPVPASPIGAVTAPAQTGATDGAATPPPAAAATAKPSGSGEAATSPAAGPKLLQTAEKIAAGLKQDKADELPAPSDAVDSLAHTTLDVDPARAYHPSPEDWRDESLYSIFLDRFNKGAGAKPEGDPTSGTSRHGGNLRGVIDKLDYIKASGVTTLLVSPVTMTVPEAYHGYAPVHFLAVDPHLGSMADFKELVAKAHEKGLRVVLDWVINHSGPVFEYADGDTQWTGDHKPGAIEWTRTLKPVELTEDDFTRERVITDWDDPIQATRGDFPPNYRHLATDRPETQAKLIKIAQWWMKETDIDGLRLDAVRHVAPGFLPKFSKEIRAYAAKLGKDKFLLLGENSTGLDRELKPFLDDGSLDTLYHYPAYRRENAALHGAEPTRALENSTFESEAALGDASGHQVRFIDLHDTYRFLLADTPTELLKTAIAFVMASAGIPLIYNGTEQAFRQLRGRLTPEGGDLPADPQNREDMFASGQYKSESSAGDAFDLNSGPFRVLRAWNDLRAKYPALRRGAQYPRWSDASGAGIYAFSRIYGGQEVLVVMNTAGEPRGADMFVDANINPAGSPLEDALNPGYALSTHDVDGGGSKVSVEVPAYGVRVLVRPAPAQ
jgi:alpha-amylase